MTFGQPALLIALIALPLIAIGAFFAWIKKGDQWKKLLAPRLRKRLSNPLPAWSHFTSLALALFGAAALIITVAQPENGEEWITPEANGRNILFCIDVSRSMTTPDLNPSRLHAARAATLEILEKFPNDRVGVLAFSGEPLVACPLTLDHDFVKNTINFLTPEDIPYGGSNLTKAVTTGARLLHASGQSSNIMIILSDGEKSATGITEAAKEANKKGVFIYALGIGTTKGEFIPDPSNPNQKFLSRENAPVFSTLNEEPLQQLAAQTNGVYSRGIGSQFLSQLNIALDQMDEYHEHGRDIRIAKHVHKWFLFSGIILIMASIFVRHLPLKPAVAAIILGFSIQPTEANPAAFGAQALKEKKYDEAHRHLSNAASETSGNRAAQFNLAAGSAAFKGNNLNAAADSFSKALTSTNQTTIRNAHYSLATTLYHLGNQTETETKIKHWKGAIEHLQSSIDIPPKHQPSLDNLASIRKQLDNLLSQQQQQNQPQDNSNDKEQDTDKQDQDPNSQNPGNNKEDDQPNKSDSNNNQSPNGEQQPGDQPPNDGNKPEDGENSDQNGNKSDQDAGNQKPPGGEPQPNKTRPGDDKEDNGNETQNTELSERPGETKEERARRLLKKFADFGGKAPRYQPRRFTRPAQDW